MSKEVEEPGENWVSNQGDPPPKINIRVKAFVVCSELFLCYFDRIPCNPFSPWFQVHGKLFELSALLPVL